MHRPHIAVRVVLMGLLLTAVVLPTRVATAAGAQLVDIINKKDKIEQQQQQVKLRLQKLAEDVEAAKELKASLNVLTLAAGGDAGALKALSGLQAPRQDSGGDCATVFRFLAEIDRQAQEATVKGDQATQLLNDTRDSEPTESTTNAALQAAKITRDMAAQTKVLGQAAGRVEAMLKTIANSQRVDLSGVAAQNGKIVEYDRRTLKLQQDANAIEQEIKQYDGAREAAVTWMQQQRSALPENERAAADGYIARVQILLIGDFIRQSIDDARKLTWTADKDVAAFRVALGKLSDARTQAASAEADLCAGYLDAASRQAVIDKTKAQIQTLRTKIDDLMAVLTLRAGKLDAYGRRNKKLLDKASAKIEAAKKAGDTATEAKATQIKQSAEARQDAINGETRAVGEARTDAGASRQSTDKGLLGIEAAGTGPGK